MSDETPSIEPVDGWQEEESFLSEAIVQAAVDPTLPPNTIGFDPAYDLDAAVYVVNRETGTWEQIGELDKPVTYDEVHEWTEELARRFSRYYVTWPRRFGRHTLMVSNAAGLGPEDAKFMREDGPKLTDKLPEAVYGAGYTWADYLRVIDETRRRMAAELDVPEHLFSAPHAESAAVLADHMQRALEARRNRNTGPKPQRRPPWRITPRRNR